MVEEVLYPAMESGVLDIIIGKGPSARTIQLGVTSVHSCRCDNTYCSVVCATYALVFRGEFFVLEFYTQDSEIKKDPQVALQKSLGLNLDDEALGRNSLSRSLHSAYCQLPFLKRCRDYAQVHKIPILQKKAVKKALALLEVDEDRPNRKQTAECLRLSLEKFKGGPVGLKTICCCHKRRRGNHRGSYRAIPDPMLGLPRAYYAWP
jgi:Holliday junction DNA helicase RuvB